jgi:co-chaperonin GroES (HSP10)
MLAIEKLTPYGDHLIVKVPNQTDLSQSNGGVYLVETIPNQERTSGIVYAIGLDHSSGRKPIPFKVGDTVFFKPYNGLEITE